MNFELSMAKKPSALTNSLPFIKMEGAGNDYIYVDATRVRAFLVDGLFSAELFQAKNLAPFSWIAKICHRHYGVGADGVIFYAPVGANRFRMIMFNADGSESEMCGNGVRCVGYLLYTLGLAQMPQCTLETGGGMKYIHCSKTHSSIQIAVDMGRPVFDAAALPSTFVPPDGKCFLHKWLDQQYCCALLSMGNPHIILRVKDPANFPLAKLGPVIEQDDHFPNRVNVSIIEIVGANRIVQRTWERGTGETHACGTGASAAVAAAMYNGWLDFGTEVAVSLPGGTLQVRWRDAQSNLWLSGPCNIVYCGEMLESGGRLKKS